MKARRNPFRSERVEGVRFRFLGDGTWDGLMARLAELGYRGAIVGSDGSGKTTLLDELAPRIAGAGFGVRRLWLNDEGVLSLGDLSCGPATRRTVAEVGDLGHFRPHGGRLQQPPSARVALERFFAELGENDVVLFDGADLLGRLGWARFMRRAMHAAGLVVTAHRRGLLPTLIECGTTRELLAGIVGELLGERVAGEAASRAAGLFEKHKGNVRDALRELYDIWAEEV
jgi:hypothetical protein